MEKNLRHCRNCGTLKLRIQKDKYPNKKDKRWVDNKGCQWSGHICGDCKREQSKLTMRRIRSEV